MGKKPWGRLRGATCGSGGRGRGCQRRAAVRPYRIRMRTKMENLIHVVLKEEWFQWINYARWEETNEFALVRSILERALFVHHNNQTLWDIYFDFEIRTGGVTRNYFENLVRALESGIKDVGSNKHEQATCSKTLSSKSLGSKGKCKAAATSSRSTAPSRGSDESNLWSCDHCTYANPRSTNICQMCEQSR